MAAAMEANPARIRRRWLRRLLFIAVAAATVTAAHFWGRHVDPPPRWLDADRVAVLTGASELPAQVGGAAGYWRIKRGEETLYAAESAALAADVRGYGGPFDLLVVVDEAGNFDRLVMVRHNETPSYVAEAPAFLASFVGLPATAPLEPGQDVDAITRATVSSEAFAAAARLTGRKILRAALGREVELEKAREPWDWPWAVVVAAFFGLAVWARRRPPEVLRIVAAAAAVGILGFWAGRFLSIGDVGRLAMAKFLPFGPRLSLYVLFAGATVAALLYGNVYCGWVCPFGAVAELLYKLPFRKLIVAPAFARKLSGLRFVLLAVVVAVIIARWDLGAASYEPFDDLFAYGAAGLSLLFLVAVLAVSAFHYRFFCRYLCAVGALWGEVAAVGREPRLPPCQECRECAQACPTGAVIENREVVDRALCIECGRCARECEAERKRLAAS